MKRKMIVAFWLVLLGGLCACMWGQGVISPVGFPSGPPSGSVFFWNSPNPQTQVGHISSVCITPGSGKTVYISGYTADLAADSNQTGGATTLEMTSGSTTRILGVMSVNPPYTVADHVVVQMPNNLGLLAGVTGQQTCIQFTGNTGVWENVTMQGVIQ